MFWVLFCGGLQSTVIAAPATKNEPEASEVPHLQHGIIIMSQIKNDDSFTKRDFWPFQNVIQIHQILRLPRRRRPKPPLILTHACQCFSSAPRVLHLPQRWKSVRCLAPVTQNHVPDLQMSRKYHACQKKWTQLKKRALCAGKTTPRESRPTHQCEFGQSKCTWASHKRTFAQEFTAKKPEATERTLIEPRPFSSYRKNPSVWTHCLGKNLVSFQKSCFGMLIFTLLSTKKNFHKNLAPGDDYALDTYEGCLDYLVSKFPLAYAGLGLVLGLNSVVICFQCFSARWGYELHDALGYGDLCEDSDSDGMWVPFGIAPGVLESWGACLEVSLLNLSIFVIFHPETNDFGEPQVWNPLISYFIIDFFDFQASGISQGKALLRLWVSDWACVTKITRLVTREDLDVARLD